MNQITKTQKLNLADISAIFLHILISLFFVFSYKENWIPIDQLKNWVSGYYFILPLVLIGVFFRPLRKMNFYLVWVILGIVQLYIYFIVKDNPDFYFQNRGTSFDGLRSLLPVMILFQIFRQNLKKKYKLEMIISIRKHRMSWYEEEEHRNMLMIEVVYSILLSFATVLFGVI